MGAGALGSSWGGWPQPSVGIAHPTLPPGDICWSIYFLEGAGVKQIKEAIGTGRQHSGR